MVDISWKYLRKFAPKASVTGIIAGRRCRSWGEQSLDASTDSSVVDRVTLANQERYGSRHFLRAVEGANKWIIVPKVRTCWGRSCQAGLGLLA